MTASADRNLLFGIIALQMDFIGRDALVAAMSAWALEKSKPLGEILVAQQALSSQRRDLIEALVQEHLKQHNDDPQRSLQSISSIKSARAELDQISDSDLKASLAYVPVANAGQDEPPIERHHAAEPL